MRPHVSTNYDFRRSPDAAALQRLPSMVSAARTDCARALGGLGYYADGAVPSPISWKAASAPPHSSGATIG